MEQLLNDITITKQEAKCLGIINGDGLGLVHKDIYKSINKQLLDLINSGEELPWRKPWRDGYRYKGVSYGPQNYVTGSPYRGANAFTMWLYNRLNNSESIYFLSEKQIKERGGKLLPEAKKILVWAFIKGTEVKKNKEGKEETYEYKGIVSYYVYDLKHTEGVKPIKRKSIKIDEKHEVIAEAETIIANMPKRPKITNDGGDRAYYAPYSDSVHMPVQKSFKEPQKYYSTLFHELVHSTGHEKRLKRDLTGKFGTKPYAFEELIAEIGAAYLCGVTNIEYYTLKNTAAYLKSWAKKLTSEIAQDKTFLFRAVLSATKAAKFIIGTTLDKHGEIVTEGEKQIEKNKTESIVKKPSAPKVKASVTEAINQLLTLPKYKQYGAMFLGMFYSIFKDTDYAESINGKLKATMFKKYEYDLFEADSVDDDYLTEVKLTAKGKEIINGIKGRLDTLRAKKAGTDMFPELAGTKITKQEYKQLLSDYDKYTGIYEDTTDKKRLEELKVKINEIANKIHSYERNYELKGNVTIATKPSEIKFETYTNDHGTFTSADYKYGTIFKRSDGTFYYKTGERPQQTYNAKTLKQAIAAIDKFAKEKDSELSGLTPALQFISRYIKLDGRTVSLNEIEKFIQELQLAIKLKEITKNDPQADVIREIQNKLINVYNNNIEQQSIKVNIKNKLKYEQELQGLGIFPEIISAAAGKAVEIVTKKLIQKDKGLGCADNKACGCNKKPSAKKIEVEKASPKNKIHIDTKTINMNSFNGVMSADKMGEVKYDSFNFNPYYKGIFGAPATNFDMCIYGDPGTGKTVFLLKLANYLAENFGPVLYVSTEEYGAPTLIDKINRFNTKNPNLHFSPKLIDPKIDLSKYKFIFIDSVNHAKINLDQYKQIREQNPNTVFVLILQTTKSGSYRGGKDWPHEVEMSMKLYKDEKGKRMLNVDKDRYANPRIVKI